MRPIEDELRRLVAAVDSGTLQRVCDARGIELMVLFGSSVRLFDTIRRESTGEVSGRQITGRPEASIPNDIDLAIQLRRDADGYDAISVLDDLYGLTGSERIDLMLLHRAGPVARQRALTRGRTLVEQKSGLFAEAQISAMMEYLDTELFRKQELALLASR